MGLIKCGSVVIPFDNQISKDTDLYKLYNTNIHENIEQKSVQMKNVNSLWSHEFWIDIFSYDS